MCGGVWCLVSRVMDSIELGLELLSIYGGRSWTQRQLDELFLPMIARLSSLVSAQQASVSEDCSVAVGRVMLGIIGTFTMPSL